MKWLSHLKATIIVHNHMSTLPREIFVESAKVAENAAVRASVMAWAALAPAAVSYGMEMAPALIDVCLIYSVNRSTMAWVYWDAADAYRMEIAARDADGEW